MRAIVVTFANADARKTKWHAHATHADGPDGLRVSVLGALHRDPVMCEKNEWRPEQTSAERAVELICLHACTWKAFFNEDENDDDVGDYGLSNIILSRAFHSAELQTNKKKEGNTTKNVSLTSRTTCVIVIRYTFLELRVLMFDRTYGGRTSGPW